MFVANLVDLSARIARVAAAPILWSCMQCAQAQGESSGLDIEPPALPLSCLTSVKPERKLPGYPTDVKPDTNAVVRVQLEFGSKDRGPVAKVVFNNGPEPFARAVRDFVADYRLPCLQPDRAFNGVQEFQFVIGQSRLAVLESAARTAAENADVWPSECLPGISSAPAVEFPSSSSVFGRVTPGLVLLRMIFTSPDKAPEISVLFDGGQRRLSNAVLRSVGTYRLQCMRPGDPPVSVNQSFVFRREGEEVARLKPELTLAQLLGLVNGLKDQKVRFDFTTMGCPFKLTVEPYQPYATNRVRQLGEHNPGRRELVEWLRNVTLDFPKNFQRTALGEPATVSVPCAVLDLS